MTSSWMLVAGVLFALMGAFAKSLAGQFSGAELAMYRSLFGLVAIGGVLLWRRMSPRTAFWRGHFWRGVTGTISLVAYFHAMTSLPLATVITLNYTSPIWLTLLSVILLKERFSRRLVAAIALGFLGVVLVLQPVIASDQAVMGLIGLASGFFAACAYVNVKKLGDAGEPAWRVVLYFSVVGTVGSALVQPFNGDFHPVDGANLWPLLGVGLAATLAQLAMTRAYHSGQTMVVGAFAYSTVIFAALLGAYFFDEQLPPLAWLGIAIIIVSGLLAGLAKASPPPAADKTPTLPAEED